MPPFKILLVDDSRTMRQVLRTHLMAKGYEFFEAESGRRAIEILEADKVDLVISDVRMSDVDGIELVREIRRREPLGGRIATILISGDHSPAVRARSFIAGADEFLEKPLDSEKLESVVAELLKDR